jgi:hypothetical protein
LARDPKRLVGALGMVLWIACADQKPAGGDGSHPTFDQHLSGHEGGGADLVLDLVSGFDGRESDATADMVPQRQWKVLGTQTVTRFVSGAIFDDRVYGGTHLAGSSAIYDFPPFQQQQFFGGESVLDFQPFHGALYSTHENGARVYRLESHQWTLVHDHGPSWDYMFFMTLFQGNLYATGGTAAEIRLVKSTTGADYAVTGTLAGWLWLPVEYQGALYLLGHGGAAYAKEPAAGVLTTDGQNFTPVPALSGGPEYQCSHVWKDLLYLGTGGWTNDRESDDTARLYRFDGASRAEVLSVKMNGVTSLASDQRYLFATVDSGWERGAGESRIYMSDNGSDWSLMHTFTDPELRHVEVLSDGSLLVFGGKAGAYGTIYAYQ